jgi:hypothetical protein
MMAVIIQRVLQDIDGLSLSDQMQVLEHLVQRVRRSVSGELLVEPSPKQKISDFRGIAKYPMLGEDAQTWVSRTRREGDESRSSGLRGEE